MNHAKPIVTPVLPHVLFPNQTAPRHPVTDVSPEMNKQRKGMVSSVIVNANFKLLDCISCMRGMRRHQQHNSGRRVLMNAKRPRPLRTDNVAETPPDNMHRYGNGWVQFAIFVGPLLVRNEAHVPSVREATTLILDVRSTRSPFNSFHCASSSCSMISKSLSNDGVPIRTRYMRLRNRLGMILSSWFKAFALEMSDVILDLWSPGMTKGNRERGRRD